MLQYKPHIRIKQATKKNKFQVDSGPRYVVYTQ